jgi:hypothetical protein
MLPHLINPSIFNPCVAYLSSTFNPTCQQRLVAQNLSILTGRDEFWRSRPLANRLGSQSSFGDSSPSYF